MPKAIHIECADGGRQHHKICTCGHRQTSSPPQFHRRMRGQEAETEITEEKEEAEARLETKGT